MALVPSTLQTKLMAVFNAMNSMTSGGDRYFADEAAKEIKAYILTGQVSTADTGTAPGGAYTGAGTGTMTIDNGALANAFYRTFTDGYSNDDLADHIASDIDDECKKENTVATSSTGTVATSNGPVPFSCSGKGKFTGTKTAIAGILKACFSAMNTMTEGGNAYFAAQFAAAVDTYLKAGTISVQLQAPASGSGSGRIA